MTDVKIMNLDTVVRSELPISKTGLDSHDNVVVIGLNVRIISDSVRKVEVSSFEPDYESMY